MSAPFLLTPELLLQAYALGVFPMAEGRDGDELSWYDPDPRALLPIAGLHVPHRLARKIRQRPYRVTFDRAFARVIAACADARPDTWINDDIIALYTALHDAGFAHSVEVWREDRLVGGLYGVALGAAFFGESMFSAATDASKIALVHLAARLWKQGYDLLDAQFVNEHLKQFGIYEVPRAEYKRLLAQAVRKDVPFYSASSSGSISASIFSSSSSSGAFSDENSSFDDVAAFLQSITHTS